MTTHHPVLFNGESVRALRADRKTEDRRPITPRNSLVDGNGIGPRGLYGDPDFWEHLDWDSARVNMGPSPAGNPGPYLKAPYPPEGSVHRIYPRVQAGDLLWVRETFSGELRRPLAMGELFYRADGERQHGRQVPLSYYEREKRWRPSIHMPRWAARDWLRVEAIGPERVQDITDEGAIAEGATSREIVGRWGTAPGWSMDWSRVGEPSRWRAGETLTEADIALGTPRMAFANFINKTYDPGAWENNGWTWATKFTRTEAPND